MRHGNILSGKEERADARDERGEVEGCPSENWTPACTLTMYINQAMMERWEATEDFPLKDGVGGGGSQNGSNWRILGLLDLVA